MKLKLALIAALLLSMTARAQILKTIAISSASVPTPTVEWLFNEGSGQQVLNTRGPMVPSDNMFGLGNDPNNAQVAITYWSINNTITDRYSLAPDGTMTAFRAQGAANDWIGKLWASAGGEFPSSGAHTMSVYVKSNTGVSQTMTMWPAFGHAQTSAKTITTSWSRISTTFTTTAGELLYGIFLYGDSDYDISVCCAQVVPGSTPTTYVDDFNLDMFLGNIGTPDPHDPTWTSAGLNFTSTEQHLSAISRGQAFTTMTVYAAAKVTIDPYTQNGVLSIIGSSCSDNLFTLGHNNTGPTFKFNNNENTSARELMKADDGQWHVWTGVYDGTNIKVAIDGKVLESLSAPGLSPITVTLIEMGRLDCASYGFKGDVGLVRLFDTAHDQSTISAEVANIRAAMAARSVTVPTVTRWTAYAGDSITADSGVPINEGYQYLATTALSPSTMGIHIGQGGSTVTAYSHTAEIDATLVPGASNVLVVAFGANDLIDVAAATFVANLKTFCLARRAAGWTVVVTTVLPHTGNGFGGTSFNTLRATANTAIRNDSSFYDALADIGDTGTTMGADAAASDTMYYQDGVHPTVTGHGLLAPIVQAAIEAVI
jgi:lysophospholipase L1-like esterase